MGHVTSDSSDFEDNLGADDPPSRSTISGSAELIVEPILLSTAHQSPTSVVGDGVDVVCVPIEVGNGAIVLSRVQHEKIEERSE